MSAGVSLMVPVKDGRLDPTPGQKLAISTFLQTREGKAVALTLKRPANTRSQNQNRYYWGVVLTTIGNETGNSTEDLHHVLKERFLPRKFISLGGKEVEVRKTTTDLTVEEFAKYLEQLAAFAATELGITLPDPP